MKNLKPLSLSHTVGYLRPPPHGKHPGTQDILTMTSKGPITLIGSLPFTLNLCNTDISVFSFVNKLLFKNIYMCCMHQLNVYLI